MKNPQKNIPAEQQHEEELIMRVRKLETEFREKGLITPEKDSETTDFTSAINAAIKIYDNSEVRQAITELVEVNVDTCDQSEKIQAETLKTLHTTCENIIESFDVVNETGFFSEYSRLVQTSTRMSRICQARDDSHYLWFIPDYVKADRETPEKRWASTYFYSVKFLKEKGEEIFLDQLLTTLYNNLDIEPLHLRVAISDLTQECYPLVEEGYRPQVEAVFDFVSKIKGFGSAPSSASQSLKREMEKLEEIGKPELATIYYQTMSKIAHISSYIAWQMAGLDNATKAWSAYEEAGLSHLFERNLKQVVEFHKNDVPIDDPRKDGRQSAAINFFLQYPLIVSEIGETDSEKLYQELFEINQIDLAHEGDRNGRLAAAFLRDLTDTNDGKKPALLGKIYSKKDQYDLLIKLVKGLAAAPDKDEFRLERKLDQYVAETQKVKHPKKLAGFEHEFGKYNLFSSEADVIKIIESGEDFETIKQLIGHYSTVKELGISFKNKKQFYTAVSRAVGLKGKDTKDWLDQASQSSQHFKYRNALPEIIDFGLDVRKTSELMPALCTSKLEESLGDLEHVINHDSSNEEKIEFLTKIKNLKKLLFFQKPTNLNFDSWKETAEAKAQKFYEEEAAQAGYEQQLFSRIVVAARTTEARDLVKKYLMLEQLKQNRLAGFEQGLEIGMRNVSGLISSVSPVDATELLVYGLISRKRENLMRAYNAYDSNLMEQARHHVFRCEIPATYFFHEIKKDLAVLQSTLTLPAQKEASAKSILGLIKEDYIDDEDETERIILESMVGRINSMFEGKHAHDEIMCRMQPYTLMDLFDGNRLSCCAFLSKEQEKENLNALYYHADSAIAIQHLVPRTIGSVWEDPIGATIMARCKTRNQQDVLLIDSAEGGADLKALPKDIYLNLFLQGIVGAAENSNSEHVFVPVTAVNKTAKAFRTYFGNKTGVKAESVHLSLVKPSGKDLPRHRFRFLEAFRNRTQLSEDIPGYCVKTTELRTIYDRLAA
ncbi:hypothetical protein HN587_03230 [Candidatus Woesearchaeota archaeon]|mgnify:CR=1 FL=1|jgi:hypothetical protein|nr:hypothetical protein [Candidatus Woesearchaeota archaeon]